MDADGLPIVGPGINLTEVYSVCDFWCFWCQCCFRLTISGSVLLFFYFLNEVKGGNTTILVMHGMLQSTAFKLSLNFVIHCY